MSSNNRDFAGLIAFIICFLVIVSVVVLFSVNNFSLSSDTNALYSSTNVMAQSSKKIYYIESNNLEPKSTEYLNLHGFIMSLKKYPQIDISVIEGVGTDYARLEEIVNNAYSKGVRYIFLSGFEKNNALGNIFRRFNEINFFVNNMEATDANVISYTDKNYVAKYLAGFVAGASSDKGNIGYVANGCGFIELRNLNAFAIGLHKATPDKTLYVYWLNNSANTDEQNYREVNDFVREYAIDVIDGTNSPCRWCRYAMYNDLYYFDLVTRGHESRIGNIIGRYHYDPAIIFDTLIGGIVANSRYYASNYYFGYSDRVIKFDYNTHYIQKRFSDYMNKIISNLMAGNEYVYSGPIYNNQGLLMVPEGYTFTDEELLHEMNWKNENIQEVNECRPSKNSKRFVIRMVTFNN